MAPKSRDRLARDPVPLKWVGLLAVFLVVVSGCDGGGDVVVPRTAPSSVAPRGLGVSLAQVEGFFDAHGSEPQLWRGGQSLSAAQGCTEFCGQNNENGGAGTGCVIGILGSVNNVGSIGMTCTPGLPLSATDSAPLTDKAALSLLSASVRRFAPSTTACVTRHLNATLREASTRTLCMGGDVTAELSSGTVSHNRAVSLTIQIP